MKYYMGNASVKIHNIHFDVLTTILDAILHIEIILLVKKTCLINVCLSQNASILSVHISCEQVKLCFSASFYHGRHLGCHLTIS